MNINDVLMDHGIISSAQSEPAKIYGVKIDTTNSNPGTAVTYTNDAVGMRSNSTDWDSVYPFNKIRPVLFYNGSVVKELNKNNFAQDINGNAVTITIASPNDVMIEFPKIYWKFETVGTDLYIRYSEKKIDSTWISLSHTRGLAEKDYIYIGAYLGYNLSSKLRSVSGFTPTTNITIGNARTYAQANGSGYEQMTYGALLMLQILYLVRYKNLDSQTALGRGYADGNSSAIVTGGTNTKGMYYGETTGKLQMKFAGLEDFWGNCSYWIDGITTDVNRNILIGTINFNNVGTGYVSYSSGLSANTVGLISTIQGTTEKGFIIKSASGSATTYYGDFGALSTNSCASFGGSWVDASSTGAYMLYIGYSENAVNGSICSRVCYI